MNKIVTIVQQPLVDRYTKEWYDVLSKFDDLYILGSDNTSNIDRSKSYNFFAGLEGSFKYELDQLSKLIKLENVEKLLITDLDFPGISSQCLPILKLKFPKIKIYSILHAGSWTNGDIFSNDKNKRNQECFYLDVCEKIFVATHYHKDKICKYFNIYNNDKIVVLNGFYFDASSLEKYRSVEKNKNVLLLGRNEQTDIIDIGDIKFDYHNSLIPRSDYLNLLSQYKVSIINKMDESFGYGVLESIACGVIPVVPNKFSYPEIVSYFRFDNQSELKNMVSYILANYDSVRTAYLKEHYLGVYKHSFESMIKIIKGET